MSNPTLSFIDFGQRIIAYISTLLDDLPLPIEVIAVIALLLFAFFVFTLLGWNVNYTRETSKDGRRVEHNFTSWFEIKKKD